MGFLSGSHQFLMRTVTDTCHPNVLSCSYLSYICTAHFSMCEKSWLVIALNETKTKWKDLLLEVSKMDEISGMQFLWKATVEVNRIYLSILVSSTATLLHTKSHVLMKKKLYTHIYWPVCKWDLLVLSTEPAADASLVYHLHFFVSPSAWLPDEASILHCFAQLEAHPFCSLWLCSSLYFPANNMILFHSLEISCILPKRGPLGCQVLLSIFGFLRLLWQGCCKALISQTCERLWLFLPLREVEGEQKQGPKHDMCIVNSVLTTFCLHLCCV